MWNLPADIVHRTFKHIIQLSVLPPSSHLQRQLKSPNSALNIHQRNEVDANDQIFSDTPAIDDEEMSSHIFVEYDSKITDVHKYKDNSGAEFLDTLQERICTRGVPIKLITVIKCYRRTARVLLK